MPERALLNRRVKREIDARKAAESILESKSLELYETSENLRKLNADLESLVASRTEALAQSEKRYRNLIEGAHDIIFVTDENGIITYINHIAESRFGHKKKDVLGSHFTEFIRPEFREKIANTIAEAISQKKTSFYIEVPSFNVDGDWVWLGQNLQFTYGEEGYMIETVGIARDITQKKRDEELLISQELQLRSLIENLHSGILFQSKRGEILQINSYFCDFFNLNLSPDELIGKKVNVIRDYVMGHFRDAEKQLTELIGSTEKKLGNEVRLQDNRFIQYDFIPIFSNKEFLGTLWQFADITAQKELELQIRNSEEKYRGIIENMELGMLEVDADGIILRAYDWFCKMTGYTEKELVGKDGKDFLLAPEFIPVLDKNHEMRADGIQSVYEVQLVKKNGERIWVIISGAPYYDLEGNIIGSVGIHFDITDQKNLQLELIKAKETAERAQEAEQRFLANMSHEIRTPLNAVIGMSHLLYDTNPTTQQKEYLEMIQYSANLLSNLVTEVLDFSKINSGNVELNETEFDLNAMFQTLYKTFELKTQNKPVNIELEKPEFETLVYGDETMLNQILYNLLGNAEKFTEKGTIKLHAHGEKKGDWITLTCEVSDTGIGIAPDKLESIFTQFSQEDRETKIKYGGTGLGLAITKNIVELMGGSITVESTKNVGTTFKVNVKLICTGKPITTKEESSLKFKKKASILVVEDNVMNQNYICRLLEGQGLNFEIADNGQIAFDLCKKMSFDIIFMDISMPVMDGYETTIKIRNSNTSNKNTPIVALTASALSTKKSKAFDVGMNDYMTKPFTPHELKAKLAQYLGQAEDETAQNGQVEENTSPQRETTLDHDVLAMYYDGDEKYAYDMFQMFLSQYDSSINQLTSAINNKNWEEGQKLAHKMKPTFSMVGAPAIQTIFQELENALRYKNEAQILTNWAEAQTALDSYLPAIKTEFERLGAAIS